MSYLSWVSRRMNKRAARPIHICSVSLCVLRVSVLSPFVEIFSTTGTENHGDTENNANHDTAARQ
jgi:hypothetical protein